MANKEALRELQTRLAERMQVARTRAARARPGWRSSARAQGLLLPLEQAGEIFTARAADAGAAHPAAGSLGVANLRGGLHGVVDLAGVPGLRARGAHDTAPSRRAWWRCNPSLGVNCALLVDRLAGLRSTRTS